MTSVAKSLGLGAVLVLLGACSGKSSPAGDNGGDGSGGDFGGGSGGSGTYTPSAACKNYATCSEQCFCTISDIGQCADICGTGTGNGGSSNSESGGATNGSSGSTNTAGGSTATGNGGSTFTGNSGGSTTTGSSGGSTATGSSGGSTATGSGGTTSTSGDNVFEIKTDSFPVPVGGNDVYKCQSFKNTTGQDIAILESDSFMSSGSHHMFVFHGTQYNTNGAMTDSNTDSSCSGVTFPSDFIHSAQTPQQTQSYPAGVGRALAAGDGLLVVVHYINLTQQTITGAVDVKFHYVPKANVQYLANEIFLNQALLSVPPGSSTKSATFTTPFAMKMLGDVSHMHSRGVAFTATAGAQTLYSCTTLNTSDPHYKSDCWDEPVSATWPTGMDVPAGTKVTWSCTYNNGTGTTLTFGEHAATNEMCIMSGVFYTTDMAHQGVAMTDATGFGF
jgi:hypothetical protein